MTKMIILTILTKFDQKWLGPDPPNSAKASQIDWIFGRIWSSQIWTFQILIPGLIKKKKKWPAPGSKNDPYLPLDPGSVLDPGPDVGHFWPGFQIPNIPWKRGKMENLLQTLIYPLGPGFCALRAQS